MKVYVNDVLVKSFHATNHLTHLAEMFDKLGIITWSLIQISVHLKSP